jgi:hypothetical protein
MRLCEKKRRDVSEILRRTISITCVSVSSILSMFRLLGSVSILCARESLDSFSLGKNACTRERTEGLRSQWKVIVLIDGLRSSGGLIGSVFLDRKSRGTASGLFLLVLFSFSSKLS